MTGQYTVFFRACYSGGNVFRSGGRYKGRSLTGCLLTSALAMMIPFLMNNTNKIRYVILCESFAQLLWADVLINSDYHIVINSIAHKNNYI
ncbi:MAG: hypothetical protein ACI9YH_000661 [Colwellia sp.]|jgi:hypothetical protein